jgi:hypothetical protein
MLRRCRRELPAHHRDRVHAAQRSRGAAQDLRSQADDIDPDAED